MTLEITGCEWADYVDKCERAGVVSNQRDYIDWLRIQAKDRGGKVASVLATMEKNRDVIDRKKELADVDLLVDGHHSVAPLEMPPREGY